MTAYIDPETRMPMLWRRNEETRTFQQLDNLTAKLALPPEIVVLSNGLKHDREILRRPAPRGG